MSEPKTRKRRRRRSGTPRTWVVICNNCRRPPYVCASQVKECWFCKSPTIETRRETRDEKAARELHQAYQRAGTFFEFIKTFLGGGNPFADFLKHPPAPKPAPSALEGELMREGYRALAKKYHPDKGGDEEAMKELNRLKEKYNL